jgi:UDP-N-acetylmuramoylalanine--D-glutamate ligase
MSAVETRPLRGANVLVLGLGRFEGGVETARFLAREGARALVSDAAPRSALEEPAAKAEALGVRLVFGPQTEALLAGIDLVVAGPAIPFDHPVLAAAEARGIPVTTEVNVVLARSRAPVLAVTGTKGKSTTAALLARMLEAAGRRVHLGGNLGRPLVAEVDAIAPTDLVVLELSSFQLWWTRRIRRSPRVTVVTNLFPDHMDRHGTLEAYAEAKRAALDFQGPEDVAVIPADDPVVHRAGYAAAGRGRRVLFGDGGAYRVEGTRLSGPEGSADLAGFPLWGAHNLRNALAAAAAALQVKGGGWEAVRAGAFAMRPLPHRLEPVAEVGGVLFVDDSNATTPQSTAKALEAVPRPVVVLVGGKEKGVDVTPLVEAVATRARGAVTIGASGPSLLGRLRGRLPVAEGGPDLVTAVRAALGLARPGDAVLLSPGFSSLDQHPSFAVRGERFRSAVLSLRADAPGP